MSQYNIYIRDNVPVIIDADYFRIESIAKDSDCFVLYIYRNKRIVAMFRMDIIAGFEIVRGED